MNTDCQMLSRCGFFNKYQDTKSLACKGFISQYCRGELQDGCKRMEYRKLNGQPPSDDMMPSGQLLSKAS